MSIFLQAEDVPICLAVRERHLGVLDFLLSQRVNHERLLSNKKVFDGSNVLVRDQSSFITWEGGKGGDGGFCKDHMVFSGN